MFPSGSSTPLVVYLLLMMLTYSLVLSDVCVILWRLCLCWSLPKKNWCFIFENVSVKYSGGLFPVPLMSLSEAFAIDPRVKWRFNPRPHVTDVVCRWVFQNMVSGVGQITHQAILCLCASASVRAPPFVWSIYFLHALTGTTYWRLGLYFTAYGGTSFHNACSWYWRFVWLLSRP